MPLLHITFHHPDFLRDDRYYPYLLEKYNFPRVPACSGYVLTEKLILVDLVNTLFGPQEHQPITGLSGSIVLKIRLSLPCFKDQHMLSNSPL